MAKTRFSIREGGRVELPTRTVIAEDRVGGSFDPPTPDISFEGVTFRAVEFTGVRAWRMTWSDALFEQCTFDRMKLEHGRFGLPPGSTFRDCTFVAADLRTIDPGHVRFERCDFANAKIEGWFAFCAEFVDCSFAGAKIARCKFSGKPLECFGLFQLRRRRRNEFHGNDFRTAALLDTSFAYGIDLDAQLLPQGWPYVRIETRASA